MIDLQADYIAASFKRAWRFDVAVGENRIMALTSHGERRAFKKMKKSNNVNVSITNPRNDRCLKQSASQLHKLKSDDSQKSFIQLKTLQSLTYNL